MSALDKKIAVLDQIIQVCTAGVANWENRGNSWWAEGWRCSIFNVNIIKLLVAAWAASSCALSHVLSHNMHMPLYRRR